MSLSNSQYDTLIRQYNQRQLKSQHELAARKEALYQSVPRLRKIEEEIASLSVSQARRLLSGDDSALETLRGQLHALREEKKQLLHERGLTEEDLLPRYTCPDCKDTGYIDGRRCHCFTQSAIDLVYTQSNIKTILSKENFHNFSYKYYSDQYEDPSTGKTPLATAREAVAICQQFIASFDEDFQNLFFFGDTGVGKTFLSNCVAKELLDSGHSVIYFSAFQLFELFEKNKFDRDSDLKNDYQNVFDCDLLIIDDLGTEMNNTFTASQLFLCLNERILRKKSTIISTNLMINMLTDRYSERTFSRISSNYIMIKITGEDIRIQKKIQNYS